MAELVKCDICGKVSNKSHVASHKRLAHGKRVTAAYCPSEPEAIEVIVSLHARLSEEGKRKVLERVFAAPPTDQGEAL
jgi:hypothetical protein